MKMKKDNGTWMDNEDGIAKEDVHFFGRKFTSDNNRRIT